MAETSNESSLGAAVTKGILIGIPFGLLIMSIVFWLLGSTDLPNAVAAAALPGTLFAVSAGGFTGVTIVTLKEGGSRWGRACLRRPTTRDVAVAQRADEDEIPFGSGLVAPSLVEECVMRLAEGSEIPQCRGPTFGPTPSVVDVRLTRRHPTSRPHTGRMLCPYPSAHGCGRTSPDGAGGNGAASVGDDVLPAAARLTGHGLPGDLGQDRAEPGQVTRLFTLAGEGADVGHDVDLACRRSLHRPGQCFAAAGEEIEEHVRLDLIQCSRVAFAPGLAGEPVDPLGRSHGQVGGQVETEQVGRGVGVGREHYATLVQPGSVAALCTLGSHLETETRQPGAELPGGESWRLGADPLQDAVGRFGADTPNTVDEDPGATQIDVSAFEQVGHGPMTPQI